MPERPEPDLDRVRATMREHDQDEAREEPRMSHGPSEPEDGVTLASLALDGDERFQALRRELGVSTFGLNLIRLRPGQRGRIHRHERQEEVYLVIAGTLTLETEGDPRELARGDLARVAPGVRRQLSNRGDEPVAVLAIGADGGHEGRDGRAFAGWDDHEGAPPQQIPMPPDLER